MTEPDSTRPARRPNPALRAKLVFRRARSYCLSHRFTRVPWLLGQRLFDGEVAQAASAMTFDLFLAAIPMLALAGYMLGRLLEQNTGAELAVSALLDLTPSEVREIVWSQFQHFSLTSVAPLVLVSALWMASAAFHTSMSMLEMAASTPPRQWWHKRLLSLGWVISVILLFGAGSWLSVQIAGGPARVLERLAWGGPAAVARLTHALLLGLMLLVGILLLGGFYRVSVSRGQTKRVWPGVVAACLVGSLISAGFAVYVRTLAKFAVFYGSLAAVAIVLGWMYLLCYVFLAGAELNAVLDHEDELADGLHAQRRHSPWAEPSLPVADGAHLKTDASSGDRQTPQPSGSSAEA
jgi:membrane protein